MKLRMLNRNYWSDFNTWIGRKKGHSIEIETPFRESHEDFGKYLYKIISPDGTIKNSLKDNLIFETLEACKEFIECWIDEQSK